MEIVVAFPPNIERLREVFPIKGREIFAWGDKIYNPSDLALSNALLAHEEVHSKQQGTAVEQWWDRYIKDELFRFEQELEAHQRELKVRLAQTPDRNRRIRVQMEIAGKLAAPLYGSMLTRNDALRLLKQ